MIGLLTLFVPLAQVTQAVESTVSAKENYALGQMKLLSYFVVLNIVSMVLNFCFVRETQGLVFQQQERSLNYLSLEEVNSVFDVKTKDHFAYQCREVTPYVFKWLGWVMRFGLGDKPEDPEEFFAWIRREKARRQTLAEERRNRARALQCPRCTRKTFTWSNEDQHEEIRCVGCGYTISFTIAEDSAPREDQDLLCERS